MKKNVHVTPNGEKWNVITTNSRRAYRTVDTQQEAIAIGRQVAINNNSELNVHKRNGQIREKNSYGNDSFPPIG